MSASDKLEAAIRGIAEKMSGHVDVGFLEGATYPDGTPVAAVAFWNEYGSSGPPRPFFRTMIAEESPSWPGKVAALAKATHNDGAKVLGLMGEDIDGALKQSIVDFTDPPLAASTIARKGFDKPLIDTAHMLNSTGYRVEGGSASPAEDAGEGTEDLAEEIVEAPLEIL